MNTLLRLVQAVAELGLEVRINATEIAIVDPKRARSCDNQLDHNGDIDGTAQILLDRYVGYCEACEEHGHAFARCPAFTGPPTLIDDLKGAIS